MMGRKSPRNRYSFMLVILLLRATIVTGDLTGAPCYNDDGQVQAGDVACDPTAQHSFCCGEDWTCLDNGICSNQNTTQFFGSAQALLARATCTDRTWTSFHCPHFCLGGQLASLEHEKKANAIFYRPRTRNHAFRY